MKSAWLQIEKQLIDSPPAIDVAKRLKKKILTSKSGVVYEGGFFIDAFIHMLVDNTRFIEN